MRKKEGQILAVVVPELDKELSGNVLYYSKSRILWIAIFRADLFLTFCDLHFLLIQNGFYLENTYVISMHAHVVFFEFRKSNVNQKNFQLKKDVIIDLLSL